MHREIAERWAEGAAAATAKRVVVDVGAAGAAARARYEQFKDSVPEEAADLLAAAEVLEGEGFDEDETIEVDLIDAQRLLGPVAARQLPSAEG